MQDVEVRNFERKLIPDLHLASPQNFESFFVVSRFFRVEKTKQDPL